jgi:NTP pyrophosphatase (non-canonical NTP hydrolase)
MTLNVISENAMTTANKHGFGDTTPGEWFANIHSEVSEAWECWRSHQDVTRVRSDNKPEGLPSELADIIIRVCDVAARLCIDLDVEVERKMVYNATRNFRHGDKRA